MTNKMERTTTEALFHVSLRGELADMFMDADLEPTKKEWDILWGNKLPTTSDLADIAHKTGYAFITVFEEKESEDDG